MRTYVRTYVSVTLRNVAVTSRRNVANQRSYVIIIARKEGGAWERNPEYADKKITIYKGKLWIDGTPIQVPDSVVNV